MPKESTNKNNVLLVEDEMYIREMIEEFLRNDGFEVFSCKSALEAYKCFEQHNIDLLVTDVLLSNESGIDIALRLTQKKKSLLVLIVSGYISEFEDEIHPEWYFLQKPFQAKQFLNLVHNLISRKPNNYEEKDIK